MTEPNKIHKQGIRKKNLDALNSIYGKNNQRQKISRENQR